MPSRSSRWSASRGRPARTEREERSIRVLYLSQYFPPEVGATQSRAYELAQGLVRAGHEVTVLTELPNHPKGVIWPDYRGRLWKREAVDGLEILRVWVKTTPRKTFWSRLAFYSTYAVGAGIAGLFARGRYDVVYATSPPLLVGAAALFLSVFRRIPLVFEVRDLWPESAVALGELRSPRAVRWAEALERRCYRRARRVVVVTDGMRARLVERGGPEEKLLVIPNGANTELFQRREKEVPVLTKELDLEGKLVVLYAGVHGIAQGLETVLESARLLEQHDAVRFLFVGEGPVKAELQKRVRELGLGNVIFHGEVPRERMPDFYSLASIALVPLRRLSLFEHALPSKLFDAWACECPVLACVEGEARALVESSRGGIALPPEEPQALADAVARLADDPASCRAWGKNGRRLVLERFTRAGQARKLEELLRGLTSGNEAASL